MACKLCLTCTPKPHDTKIAPFVMPTLPSQGLAAQAQNGRKLATPDEVAAKNEAAREAREARYATEGKNNNAVSLPPVGPRH